MIRTKLTLATALLLGTQGVYAAEDAPPFLGIHGQDVSADGSRTGAIIRGVAPDSPAAKAGLKDGDMVLAIGDKPIISFADLAREVRSKDIGTEVDLTISREGKEEKVKVTLGEMPAIPQPGRFPFGMKPENFRFRIPGPNQPGGIDIQLPSGVSQYFGAEKRPMIGVQLQPLDEALRERLGVKDAKGVIITDVVPDSPAAKAELQETDVLLEVNGKPIEDPKMLAEVVSSAKAGDEVTLKVQRGDQTMEKRIKVEEMAAGPRFGNFGDGNAEFAESVLIPRAKVAEMQKKIDDLEAKVEELTKQMESLKSAKP